MQEQDLPPEVPSTDPKERLTEVTSIAKEEAKTGTKINLPSPEQLVSNAAASLMRHRKLIAPLFGDLSKKATLRALYAIFDLPQDKVKVEFKSQAEEQAFAIGQTMMRDIFLIMQHHIYMQRKEIAQQVAVDQQAATEEPKDTTETKEETTNNTQTQETTNE